MSVGFVGLGRMGVGMAPNLSKAGHRLTVYNRTQATSSSRTRRARGFQVAGELYHSIIVRSSRRAFIGTL
jgi:3-hydroxyisobutyrate dehydrogenase-like beta-hydroxyacid dehydrogenase